LDVATQSFLLKHNRLSVQVGEFTVNALLDSGSDVSIISEKFWSQLQCVATPWSGSRVRGADGRVLERPSGTCTICVKIGENEFVVPVLIFRACVADLLLGWDFLVKNGAFLDCAEKQVQFPFTSSPELLNLDIPIRHTGRVHSQILLDANAATIVKIMFQPRLPDDTTLVLSPKENVYRTKHIATPYCIVTTRDNCVWLPITNFLCGSQSICAGFQIVDCDVINVKDAVVGTLTTDAPGVVNKCEFETSKLDLQATKTSTHNLRIAKMIDSGLHGTELDQLTHMLAEFNCFDSQAPTLTQATNVMHQINVGDATPIRQTWSYRSSAQERSVMRDEVSDMLLKNVIEKSSSPWASPVVLVKKKDNSWRFCIDFRRLNAVTKKDVYPLPRIDDALDSLHGASYFSTIDLKSGYWQIPMDPKDAEKTAFMTPDGLYQFKVMPFGLCNAPATFERFMDHVLRGLKWYICLCYLDDILVFSASFKEHLVRLRKVLCALQNAGLQLNSKKCLFGARRVKVLGHIVDAEGIRPDSEKTEAVAKFPVPRNVKELQSFLGLSSYFRRFISHFADRAQPLYRLTIKDATFTWEESEQAAFDDLKRALLNDPVLAHFNQDATTELHTDASSFGLGAVLLQSNEVGVRRPIAYASRTLTSAERNYSTSERECLAIVWAVQKFRPYLYGKQFDVITDHHSLCWLANMKDPVGRLARWSLRLQEYDMNIIYKSGQKHTDADGLSRRPETKTDDYSVSGAILEIRRFEDLIALQAADAFCQPILDHLNNRQSSVPLTVTNKVRASWSRLYCLVHGVLYRRGYVSSVEQQRIVIPKVLREGITEFHHDDPASSHLGFAKTFMRIYSRFYWPAMRRYIAHYVRSCVLCQSRKSPSRKAVGPLQPIQPPQRPFENVGIDFLGPLPESENGNRHILVCVDYLTRFAETCAVRSANAKSVAKFYLERIVLRHGSPSVLISDRGKAFLSQVVKETLELCKTVHRRTTSYHPQCNGLTERFNHTLGDMLSMYVNSSHTNWDQVLPFVTYGYNTAVQTSTGFTPFRLVYGREVVTPLDALLSSFHHQENHSVTTRSYIEAANEARDLARQSIINCQDLQQTIYNETHPSVMFHPGDLVWVWFPARRVGLAEKLLRKYFGPYKIVRQTGPVNYEVSTLGSQSVKEKKDIVHVSRLKLHIRRSPEELL
jgi:hypothetical protein